MAQPSRTSRSSPDSSAPAPRQEGGHAAGSPEDWLDEHGDVLFGYACRRVKDRETAEELVQETLLAALEGRRRFAGRSTVRTWLVGILRNRIHQHRRKAAREAGQASIDAELSEAVVDQEFNPKGYWQDGPQRWPRGGPQDPESAEFQAALEACLGQLPDRTREAFILSEQYGLSAEELCKVVDVSSTNHVYVMLHRARAALRQCLERRWSETKAQGPKEA